MQLLADGAPVALLPLMEVRSAWTGRRGVCLPFSDLCAPLMLGNCASLVLAQLREIARERRWSYFEIRGGSLLPENAPAFKSYYGHTLDLQIGSAALGHNFDSSTQRAVRKAERSGLRASIQTTAEATMQFYRLHLRTRRRHGVPPQPRSFFNNIYRHIIAAGLGFLVMIERANKTVAAAMFFKFARHAIYKFGASDERWQNLRPNNLAMAEAIRHLADSGVKTLHFGRTDKENEGLRRFKLSWGAREHEISYGKFAICDDSWVETRARRSTLHHRIFRALPTPVNRLAGVLLYPHLD